MAKMKPIDDCSLKDILDLFNIEELNQQELKIAKKKVLLLHPDKNIGTDTNINFFIQIQNRILNIQMISLLKHRKRFMNTIRKKA